MRTLIPAGGGIDSTALALRVLRESEDEVILSYYREPRYEFAERIDREQRCHEAVAEWLSDTLRPVRAVSREQVSTGASLHERWPVRHGFMEKLPVWGAWGRDRYATHAAEAEHLGADRVLLGLNAWDTDTDWDLWCYPDYARRTTIPMELPFHADDGIDPTTTPHGSAEGRFQIQAALPDELYRLTYRCTTSAEPCGACQRCSINAFYDRFCRGRSMEEIAAVDDAIEQAASFGKWRHQANPLTWSYTLKYDRTREVAWMEARDAA